MGKVFLLIVTVFALLFWQTFYCLPVRVASSSSVSSQQEVLRQLSNKYKNCLCSGIRVVYRFKNKDNYESTHIAYFDSDQKTLRIEIDPGSGWAFGWENVDVPLIEQVLKEGGDFSLFTKYRPNSKHSPYSQEESF